MTRKKSDKTAQFTRTAVVVLGMHRSGTSVLSGLLSVLGCALPGTLMKASPDNPKGYFESDTIRSFNDIALASVDSHWADIKCMKPDWQRSLIAAKLDKDALRLLKQEFKTAPLIVMKDPRNSRIFDFWAGVLNQAGYDMRVVVAIRNPAEVADSLAKRDQMSRAYAMLLWLRHLLDAEAASRHLPRSFVAYDDVLADWPSVIDRLQSELSLIFPQRPKDVASSIKALVSNKLRHNSHTTDNLGIDADASKWVVAAYEILLRWTKGEQRKEDQAQLDSIRQVFDTAYDGLMPLVFTANENRNATQERLIEAQTSLSAPADLTAKNKELSQKIDTLQGADENLRKHLADRDQKIEALRLEKAERDGQIKALTVHVKWTTQELAILRVREAELAEMTADLAASEARAEAAQQERIEREALISRLQEEAHVQSLARDVAEQNAAETRETLTETQTRLERLEQEVSISLMVSEASENLIKKERAEHRALLKDRQASWAQLEAGLRQEIRTLRDQLDAQNQLAQQDREEAAQVVQKQWDELAKLGDLLHAASISRRLGIF